MDDNVSDTKHTKLTDASRLRQVHIFGLPVAHIWPGPSSRDHTFAVKGLAYLPGNRLLMECNVTWSVGHNLREKHRRDSRVFYDATLFPLA